SADVAENGLEAIEALERQPYDVVLMDVQMPQLDGLDATRRICERWPAESRPHIIAMTANALPEDREACFAAGMNAYVAQPTLRRSLDEQGTEELRRAAHTLKSNGATLGAGEFAELCRTLEQRAKAGELDGASQLVEQIEQEYGPLRDALTALRSEPVS